MARPKGLRGAAGAVGVAACTTACTTAAVTLACGGSAAMTALLGEVAGCVRWARS